MIGNSTTYQNRKGGDVFVIRNQADDFHQYFEKTNRFATLRLCSLTVIFPKAEKSSPNKASLFSIEKSKFPLSFQRTQFNSYTDVSYFHPIKNHALVFGFNAVYDRFKEKPNVANLIRRNETERLSAVTFRTVSI
jgi:hypothetical protein